jgi:HPt (histidine-containing phosphotransfer) domain-containing protein
MYIANATLPEGAPPSFERAIDLVHLARQTLGDRALEREVLDLFVLQARAVIAMLRGTPDAKRRADLAHTLKGSARSVGAWRVAAEAEACEAMITAQGTAWSAALDALSGAVSEAIGVIEDFAQAA